MHVAEARQKIGSRVTWLCDSMENDLKHALGDAPNSEFIIDPAGTIVRSRDWSRPEQLRQDLAELVGEVRPATTVADLGMKPLEPPQTAPKGVVPRLELPARMVPLQVTPRIDDAASAAPFYAKLRAEAEQSVVRNGDGQLYLGFFLDPLYEVHWNNEAAPVRYEITTPPGVTVTPVDGMATEIDVPADADPREFLLSVTGSSREPLQLTVRYFACDDAETFCRPVTQQYEIQLTQDRDGGSRRGSGRPSGSPGSGGPNPEQLQLMLQRIPLHRALDRDGNGELSEDEIAAAAESLRRLDRNEDGRIESEELRPSPRRR